MEYYRCHAYIRPAINAETEKQREEIKKTLENTVAEDSNSTSIKRHLEELQSSINESTDKIEQETARKLAKLLERKRRKTERIEKKLKYIERNQSNKDGDIQVKKSKYINCNNCKNPKGDSCEHSLCRKCCKEKVFTEEIECKGNTSTTILF